ncbi:MAG TPA: methyltransferase, partial [Caulobacteraceae bacterium]
MANPTAQQAVYGAPLAALARVAADAVQFSPLVLGAEAIERAADAAFARIVIHAPPGTLERRYVLAQSLRVLAPGGELIALALKGMGGARLAGELRSFGCAATDTAKRHYRICRCVRPIELVGLETAIAGGALQFLPALDSWTQPGVFSWNRIDPGSALLLAQPWTPAGAGVDLGCGSGVLSRAVLTSSAVSEITLIDLDRRAIDAAKLNV